MGDVVTVKQIGQYPQETRAGALDALLTQPGGTGFPYASINAPDLVATALWAGQADLQFANGHGLSWPGSTILGGAGLDAASLVFGANLWLTSSAPFTAPAIAISEPTERSMPPVAMTSVTPTETMTIVATWVRFTFSVCRLQKCGVHAKLNASRTRSAVSAA